MNETAIMNMTLLVVVICAAVAAGAAIAGMGKSLRNRKDLFFISPVRNITSEVEIETTKHVEKLENEGKKVFWPKRDNPYQKTDLIGTDICDANFKEILERPEIHIWLTKESTGSIFDCGGVYMLLRILKYKKKIVFANKKEFTDMINKPEKSFPRLLDFLEKTTK